MSDSAAEQDFTLSRPWRWAISLVLLWHLIAVSAPPFLNATEWAGQSHAASRMEGLTRWYTRALHLHHAYFFFAPDPGPSYLIRYEARYPDGRETVSGRFPDLRVHRPRLLYHRHFMLTEQLAAVYADREPPPEEAGPLELQAWARRRSTFTNRARSYRDHLRQVLGTEDVELTLIEHRQPTLGEFFEGMRIDDPRLYSEIPLLRPSESAPEPLQAPASAPRSLAPAGEDGEMLRRPPGPPGPPGVEELPDDSPAATSPPTSAPSP